MDKGFWLERWQRAEIGFHQSEINPYLLRHWHALQVKPGSQVFVPLCGKSLDMLWLRQQGHDVLGVELSPIAVRDFFVENGMTPTHVAGSPFERCEAQDIRILCGDFFDLTRADMAQVGAVYDRASLVALPLEMRAHYAHHLLHILPPGTPMLLVTFDYPQQEMAGPPFAVSPQEVRALYGDHAEVRLLAQEDVLEQNPRFKARGVTRLQENVYQLTFRH